MITLARRNGHPVIVNADLIEIVERGDGDSTIVTLTTGNVLDVVDAPEAVLEAVVAYRRRLGAHA